MIAPRRGLGGRSQSALKQEGIIPFGESRSPCSPEWSRIMGRKSNVMLMYYSQLYVIKYKADEIGDKTEELRELRQSEYGAGAVDAWVETQLFR